MTAQLRVGIPPVGMNARLLTVNFIAKIFENPRIEVEILNPNIVLITADTIDQLTSAINSTIKEIGNRLGKKLEKGKIQDFFMHKNDRNTFGKLIGQNLSKGARFCETLATALQRVNLMWNDLQKLEPAYIIEKPQEIILGDKDFALPMEILYERYEAKYEFLKGRGGRKIKFRGSRAWLYILLSGFALGYGGIYGNEMLQVYLSEDILSKENIEVIKLLIGEGGVIDIITTLRVPPRPVIPYFLYITCEVLKIFREKGLISNLLKGPSIIQIDRVSVGRAISLIEKLVLDLSPFLERLNKLEELYEHKKIKRSPLKWISNKARRTITLLWQGNPGYGAYSKLMIEIYNILQGASEPIDLCYYALREVAEFEVAKLEETSPAKASKYLHEEATNIEEFLKAFMII